MDRDFLLKHSDTGTPSHVNSQFWYTSRIPAPSTFMEYLSV